MSASPTNLIYGLVDPRTLLIRYVGMTSNGMRRPKDHRRPSGPDTYCRRWVKSLQREGLAYQIVVLEILETSITLPEAERWWIAYGRASGWPLTNLNGGGHVSEAELLELRERRIARAEQKKACADQERVRLSPEEVAERAHRWRLENEQNVPRGTPRDPVEVRNHCFQLFEKYIGSDKLFVEVVISARVTLDEVEQLYEEWLLISRERSLKAVQADRLEAVKRILGS